MSTRKRKVWTKRKTRQERLEEVMFEVFEASTGGRGESSHAVAVNIGLKPSHYVRGLLNDLLKEGLLIRQIEALPNGKFVHVWHSNIAWMDEHRSDWKMCLMEKYGAWPERLF